MMIEIQNLVKKYKQHTVLDIESISIDKGEIVGLFGNNGAGKSTLFYLLLDLIKASDGYIRYKKKHVVTQTEKWKKYTGAFLDDDFLIDFLYPREYFSLLAKLHGIGQTSLSGKLDFFAPFFDGEILDSKKLIRELSDGNKQKVGIVSAFLHDPDIVILDEPFNMIDPRIKIRLQNILLEINQKKQTTMLISSNILESMVSICTRVILLEKGEINLDESATPESIQKVKNYFAER
jgi:ABC-2 type transport system ATP-binding protein